MSLEAVETPGSAEGQRKFWEKKYQWWFLPKHLVHPLVLLLLLHHCPLQFRTFSLLCNMLWLQQCSNRNYSFVAHNGTIQGLPSYPAHKLEFLALKWSVTKQISRLFVSGKLCCSDGQQPTHLHFIICQIRCDQSLLACCLFHLQF